ncbi:unnamed protein product [Urochloa humidicola]
MPSARPLGLLFTPPDRPFPFLQAPAAAAEGEAVEPPLLQLSQWAPMGSHGDWCRRDVDPLQPPSWEAEPGIRKGAGATATGAARTWIHSSRRRGRRNRGSAKGLRRPPPSTQSRSGRRPWDNFGGAHLSSGSFGDRIASSSREKTWCFLDGSCNLGYIYYVCFAHSSPGIMIVQMNFDCAPHSAN